MNVLVTCRFTRETLIVLSYNGCIVRVQDVAGNISDRIVGDVSFTHPRR